MLKGWAMVLAFTTIALAGCAGSEDVQDFGTVEAPRMMAGYAYAYDIMGNVEFEAAGSVDGEPMDAENDSIVIPQMPLYVAQILNTSFGPNGSFYLAAARFTDAPAGGLFGEDAGLMGKVPFAVRKADLAPFDVTASQAQKCDAGCRLTTTAMEISGETPLTPYLDFPLTAGKTWQNRVDLGLDPDNGDLQAIIDSRVVGVRAIELSNGSVDTILVQHTLRLPTGTEFEDALVAELESEGAEDVILRVAVDGGMETYYAETFQNVVREVTRVSMVLDLSFTIEGHDIVAHVSSAADITRQLSGAALDAEPDMDMAAVYAFFDGATPVKQPGTTVTTGDYTIRVTADAAEINAASKDAVQFTVAASPAMPAADKIRYTVSSAAGKLVDNGVGDRFTVMFDEAGLYQVVVQAVSPSGIVQAVDAMMVAADYEATVGLTCGNVILAALPQSNSCTSAAVPLRTANGLQGASIIINADNDLAYGGTFRITDAAGTQVEKDADDGEGFTLADLSALAIGPDGWTATWHRDAALLEDASVTITLDYGPATSQPGSESEPMPGGLETRSLVGRLLQGQFSRVLDAVPDLA